MDADAVHRRLPAEWEEQDAVLMAWPHEGTEWNSHLHEVQEVYLDISRAVTRYETLVMVAPDTESVRRRMERSGIEMDRLRLLCVDTNDTWARDFGPVTVVENEGPRLLDFGFNGWGLKFPADRDNLITRSLARQGAFGKRPLETLGLILEGGSIDCDGQGTLLTTGACLLSSNRNPHLSRREIETLLGESLGANRFLWLESGHLEGDDTDSHVDTLARFCSQDTIVFTACDDPRDEHYEPLARMAHELAAFRTVKGEPYGLFPLPWPEPCHDTDGQRLPATYANFLIINGAVLVPTYGSSKDFEALEIFRDIFPRRQILGIPCRPLLVGRGSLHCVTMQLPKGALA